MNIKELFCKNKSIGTKPEFIIAGLGNPGMVYENTRHNAGFMTIDKLISSEQCTASKRKFKSDCTQANISGVSCLLLKPQTFMNNSGEAIEEALSFYKLPPEKLIVVCDDISLNVSKLRIRRKGSSGGHNGLKSIAALTGSENYIRIKIGVGKKPHPDYDLAKWVLSKFSKEELTDLDKALDGACDSIRLIVAGKINEAMNKHNS